MKNRWYYISQGDTIQQHLKNVEAVAAANVDWIQLRLKNYTAQEVMDATKEALAICAQHNTTLFLNDYVEIAQKCAVQGVHIGKEDLDPIKARSIFTKGLIGGTANTLSDCQGLVDAKVDYIGLGPYRYTQTKAKLSPVLGLDGITEIIKELRRRGTNIPVVAIGGIQIEDCKALLSNGVERIAVSGLMSHKSTQEIKEIMHETELFVNEKLNVNSDE